MEIIIPCTIVKEEFLRYSLAINESSCLKKFDCGTEQIYLLDAESHLIGLNIHDKGLNKCQA